MLIVPKTTVQQDVVKKEKVVQTIYHQAGKPVDLPDALAKDLLESGQAELPVAAPAPKKDAAPPAGDPPPVGTPPPDDPQK